MMTNKKCPQCHEGPLRSWDELSDEERELIKRLPDSAEYEAAERESMHRWCTRCWHETTSDEASA